jgi:simple sugar transport system permease protein
VAFKCGLLNIGAEGQLIVAAFATAWVGLVLPGWPWMVVVVLAMIAAITVGGIWAGIPGVLKARFGAHEVITTIMMNFIAAGLVSYLTQYHYRKPGDPILETLPIAENVSGAIVGPHIPRMSAMLAPFGISFPNRLPLNLAFLFALAACAIVYVFLWKTKWGYELRAVGINPSAAEYGGISIARNVVIAMFISGMLAGMVGINDVLGYRYRYYHNFSANMDSPESQWPCWPPQWGRRAAILFGALIRSAVHRHFTTTFLATGL